MNVYTRIIKVLQQIPDTAAYKSYTMTTVNERLKIVQNVTVFNEYCRQNNPTFFVFHFKGKRSCSNRKEDQLRAMRRAVSSSRKRALTGAPHTRRQNLGTIGFKATGKSMEMAHLNVVGYPSLV